MAATKGQQIGIWVIVVFMVLGTFGSFAIIILGNKNSADDAAKNQQLQAEVSKAYKEYQANKAVWDKEVSGSQYFDKLNQFKDTPAPFDKESVKELSKVDLIEGEGEPLTDKSSFAAFYIGWNPDGKVFDSSFDGDKLKAPFEVTPPAGAIDGWLKGVVGMKPGGVRELTIPANLAYGDQGSGDDIPANTPLKFIILLTPEPVKMPQLLMDQFRKRGIN